MESGAGVVARSGSGTAFTTGAQGAQGAQGTANSVLRRLAWVVAATLRGSIGMLLPVPPPLCPLW